MCMKQRLREYVMYTKPHMLFKKNNKNLDNDEGCVLLLQVPRTNEKKELAAEQLFASLHGLLSSTSQHNRVSFEIAVINKQIGFYFWVPNHLKTFVTEQIYAQYPDVHIAEVEDYSKSSGYNNSITGVQLSLTANESLPIRTFPSFEVDPLAAITATLAQFNEEEEAWIQFIITPESHHWHKKSERYVSKVSGSAGKGIISTLLTNDSPSKEKRPLAEHEQARVSAAQEKSHKLAYKVTIRIVYKSSQVSQEYAKLRIQSIASTFRQFNTTYLNGFKTLSIIYDPRVAQEYSDRLLNRAFTCNIEEVASLYHLPHTNVETPNILWSKSQTAEPPANLPLTSEFSGEVSPIAATNFRGHDSAFGLPRGDRNRHLYIIGQTGVGKSGLLELLTISDIHSPYGFAVIDPHGDFALNVLRRIPAERMNDVIYFNPADTENPISFNPMEVYDDKLKSHVCSELIGVLKRMFESWGPRLEYILRYSLLALLDYPEATMLDITRILTDKKFRKTVLTYVADPVVRNFWEVEFSSWNDRFAAEAVAPVLNKVGAFTANPIIRNIIGQPKSSFNVRDIMDQRKILIVNLSRGLIGEDNASLLGALLVTKIQMGAMSRADIDIKERIPFYLYVDEFQNFATDSFATILSEARKYGLNLTVANQYIAQMAQSVKDAVFGNVGSIIAFRTSADDARNMTKYFEPKFTDHDLVHMHNRHIILSVTLEGEKVQAFSAITISLPEFGSDYSTLIMDNSRRLYSFSKSSVEEYVGRRYLLDTNKNVSSSETPPTPADASDISVNSIQKAVRSMVSMESIIEEIKPPKRKHKRIRKRRNRQGSNQEKISETEVKLR